VLAESVSADGRVSQVVRQRIPHQRASYRENPPVIHRDAYTHTHTHTHTHTTDRLLYSATKVVGDNFVPEMFKRGKWQAQTRIPLQCNLSSDRVE